MKKICSKCKIEKELTEFNKSKASKDGHRPECRECQRKIRKTYYQANGDKEREQVRAYREANKDKIKEYIKTYREANKDKIKEQSKTYREANKDKIKAYRETNREEINRKLREHYKNNKERYKEYNRQYTKTEKGRNVRKKKEHKRRAIKVRAMNLGNYTLQELEECRKFFNYCCAYSGEPLKDNEEVEHIIPISKGGTNNINNIILATKEVNSSKGAKDIDDWYPKQPYYSKSRHNKIKEWIELKSQVNLFEVI